MDESVFGYTLLPSAHAMYERIAQLTRRPLRFTQLSPRMVNAAAGCEIFPHEITIAVRPDQMEEYSIAHELAHIIIELESPYLALGPGFARGSQERITLGTLTSCFEHTNVYDIVRSYGVDTTAEEDQKVQSYRKEVEGLRLQPPAPLFFNAIAVGMADLKKFAPNHPDWPDIEEELGRRHALTLRQAQQLEAALTEERIANRDFRGMFNDVANRWAIVKLWRDQVQDHAAARDVAA